MYTNWKRFTPSVWVGGWGVFGWISHQIEKQAWVTVWDVEFCCTLPVCVYCHPPSPHPPPTPVPHSAHVHSHVYRFHARFVVCGEHFQEYAWAFTCTRHAALACWTLLGYAFMPVKEWRGGGGGGIGGTAGWGAGGSQGGGRRPTVSLGRTKGAEQGPNVWHPRQREQNQDQMHSTPFN